jgi:hypothetical protein
MMKQLKKMFWYQSTLLEFTEGINVYRVERFSQDMEIQHKDASDWLPQTVQGVMAEDGDVTDAVENHCPFFYTIVKKLGDFQLR